MKLLIGIFLALGLASGSMPVLATEGGEQQSCGCCGGTTSATEKNAEQMAQPKEGPKKQPEKKTKINDFDIVHYWVYMQVGEDNKYQIREEVGVDFHKKKHGFLREIPTWKKVGDVWWRNSVEDLKASERMKVESGRGGALLVKLGDPDRYVQGIKTYELKYKFDAGADYLSGADEFYYNIIPNSGKAETRDIKFQIQMPKAFDPEKIDFAIGAKNSTVERRKIDENESEGVWTRSDGMKLKYRVYKQSISGEFEGLLTGNEVLTIRVELPEGYFKGESVEAPFRPEILIAIALGMAILVFVWWLKHGKDMKVIETVEFYPPNKSNSLEIALYYKGVVNQKHVVSLIIYLASQGYIKIIENSKSRKNRFTFVKLKDYTGDNKHERMLMEALFKGGDKVKSSDAGRKLTKTLPKILTEMNRTERFKVIDKKSKLIQGAVVGLSILLLVLTFVMFDLSFASKVKYIKNYPLGTIAINLSFLVIAYMLIMVKIMPSRTKFGTEMLGKVRGFRRFLRVAEKAKLEKLVEKNPSYFYEILPFAYVLGVSKVWARQFESIQMPVPDWYEGRSLEQGLRLGVLTNNLTNSLNAISVEAMPVSHGSSSYGGGGSGGSASSGGGAGGGSAGSW